MDNLHELLERAYLEKRLQGDFFEAGVWRGGNCIYAKGFMEAYGVRRQVWVADSFAGLPGKEHPRDSPFWTDWNHFLGVPQQQVADHFERFGLMDELVRFVPGFFKVSLPQLRRSGSVHRLAILRLDGDMYKSTLEILCYLYDLLEVGGYWIVDDWNIPSAKRAVWDFVKWGNLTERPVPIGDGAAVWFEKRPGGHTNVGWCKLNQAGAWP